jgi:CRISPR/Cas system CMR-associated protein Cmr5 small subunit
MQNLDQIRAAAALKVAEKKTNKADVSKLPAMIIGNGLLAATAFATELNKDGGYKREAMAVVLNGTAEHLANPIHGLTVLAGNPGDATAMAKALAEQAEASDLQRATTEALAFIGYVKRYARKEDSTCPS